MADAPANSVDASGSNDDRSRRIVGECSTQAGASFINDDGPPHSDDGSSNKNDQVAIHDNVPLAELRASGNFRM